MGLWRSLYSIMTVLVVPIRLEKFALVIAVKSWRRNIGQKWWKIPDVQLSIGMCFRMLKMRMIRKRIKIRRVKMVEKKMLTEKEKTGKTIKTKKLVKGTKTKTKRQKKRGNETTLIKKSSVAAENEL